MSNPAGPTSVVIDEIETEAQPSEQPKPATMAEVKLESDDVPQELRGKSVADVMAQMKQLQDALRLSEQARLAQGVAPVPVPQAPPSPPEPPELTKEQLLELHSNDPLAAIEYMQARALRTAERNLETRLSPLVNGANVTVEQAARAKYAEEFTLFGDQISSIVNQMPNAKAVFSNPQAWDDAIALVRGRPGNLERLIEVKTASKVQQKAQEARQQEVENVGFSSNEGRVRSIPRSVEQLDATQLEIADKLGMSPAEYVKWSNV